MALAPASQAAIRSVEQLLAQGFYIIVRQSLARVRAATHSFNAFSQHHCLHVGIFLQARLLIRALELLELVCLGEAKRRMNACPLCAGTFPMLCQTHGWVVGGANIVEATLELQCVQEKGHLLAAAALGGTAARTTTDL